MTVEERLERIERLLVVAQKSVLTVPEAALLLGLTEGRVRHLCCERSIPYYKRGGRVYFKRDEVEGWQLEMRVPTYSEMEKEAATRVVLSGVGKKIRK